MKVINQIVLIILFIISLGCNNTPEKDFEKDEIFPDVKNLKEYNQTTFLTTLETPFISKQNGIYAASMLFAWEEIKTQVSEPIKEIDSEELARMNSSKSYQNTLLKNEYNSSVELDNLTIRAKAFFKKSLPFEVPLKLDDNFLQFLEDEVVSFGFKGDNDVANIMYYNNDDDFAIELIPKDKDHVIILVKSHFDQNINFSNEINRFRKLQTKFDDDRNEKNYWKYYFQEEDIVSIPIIDFNIETNYLEIEGSRFTSGDRRFIIEIAYQRTAFRLDEKGAEVESESEMYAALEELMEEPPKPKSLIFDKPFMVFLKRKGLRNPYFAMYLSNSELMRKK